jgi:hypothetical protein
MTVGKTRADDAVGLQKHVDDVGRKLNGPKGAELCWQVIREFKWIGGGDPVDVAVPSSVVPKGVILLKLTNSAAPDVHSSNAAFIWQWNGSQLRIVFIAGVTTGVVYKATIAVIL